MRPKRIEIEGFASYRSHVEVDLRGAEFFSLSGATGSGKSSVVDAIIFALYGRIPKLGARAVAPVISAGSERARVAFDFEAGGEAYTAVRLAQRTKGGGASVKEARLQLGDKVIADGASNVTAAVEELLRLRFDDFTRTVVLPQGEFARFLHADKSERQALLRNLLGLDIFTAVRALARTRETVANDRAEGARARLAGLDIPDEDAIASARDRLAALEDLSARIIEMEKRLSGLSSDSLAASERVAKVEDRLERLQKISPPDRLDELDTLAAAAREKVSNCEESLEKSESTLASIDEELSQLPTPDAVQAWVDMRRRLEEAKERMTDLDDSRAVEDLDQAELALEKARRRAADARRELENERISHAAHALTTTLEVGKPCPVCDREVEEIPERDPPASLAALEAAENAAMEALQQATDSSSEAKTALTALAAKRSEVEAQIDELEAGVADVPDLEELAEIERRHRELAERLSSARAEVEEQRRQHRLAQRELEDLSDAVRSVRKELMAAHQVVSELSPPLSDSDDAIVQWKEFLVWRDEQVAETRLELEGAKEALKVAQDEASRLRETIIAELTAVGAQAAEPFAVGVTRELQVAKTHVDEIMRAVREKEELETLIETEEGRAAVAGALAAHLKADGFERWLMAGAMADLVAGANDRLEQLSGGGYSLDSDESGSFSIIDHHNANENRLVATLSGGETFLVSLALALSLAETLAARGGADLDAIIIDEGFGTLDDESLDTVASVLEELSGGLMVGVITHVKELANRAPTRFEVVREPGGSKVESVP